MILAAVAKLPVEVWTKKHRKVHNIRACLTRRSHSQPFVEISAEAGRQE